MPDTNSSTAWYRFLRNPLAISGMILILVAILLAILGYLIIPDRSPNANQQHIEMAARKPGFSVRMLKVCKNEVKDDRGLLGRMLFGQKNPFSYIPVNDVSMVRDSLVVIDYSEDTLEFRRSFHLADVIYPLDPGNKQGCRFQ